MRTETWITLLSLVLGSVPARAAGREGIAYRYVVVEDSAGCHRQLRYPVFESHGDEAVAALNKQLAGELEQFACAACNADDAASAPDSSMTWTVTVARITPRWIALAETSEMQCPAQPHPDPFPHGWFFDLRTRETIHADSLTAPRRHAALVARYLERVQAPNEECVEAMTTDRLRRTLFEMVPDLDGVTVYPRLAYVEMPCATFLHLTWEEARPYLDPRLR